MLYNVTHNNKKVAIIGLGYVGMPLAIEFSKQINVIGFDIDKNKVQSYIDGIDMTNEVGQESLKKARIEFTCNEEKLKEADFFIIAVPTPINSDKTPDLTPIIGATKIVARNMRKASIVVYESTVYPGLTEEICVPILEKISGFKYKRDFKVGYSPERINPGDKINKLTNVVKIVSGCDEETLQEIANMYEKIIKAGVYKVESIKVAEATKILENSQRDINIAFMNEISIIFEKMNIDTQTVLKACKTKWNFLDFDPGLVGGNCIGVDPYYLIYKANELGYVSKVMSCARCVNDFMGQYVAENTIKKLILADKKVKDSNVGIFGITFKENCPDCSNTKVLDIIDTLKSYGTNIQIFDPIAKKGEVEKIYNLELSKLQDMKDLDVIIFAVNHNEFKRLFDLDNIAKMYKSDVRILIDIKGIFNNIEANKRDYIYWRL